MVATPQVTPSVAPVSSSTSSLQIDLVQLTNLISQSVVNRQIVGLGDPINSRQIAVVSPSGTPLNGSEYGLAVQIVPNGQDFTTVKELLFQILLELRNLNASLGMTLPQDGTLSQY